MRHMRTLLLAAALAATLATAATATAAAPVISGLNYSGKPLYDDQSFIGVTFTASRKARPGYEYGIVIYIGGKSRYGTCSSIVLSWDPKFGGTDREMLINPGRYNRVLAGTRYGYFCRGTAYMDVVEHRHGSSSLGASLGAGSHLTFRVIAAP